MEQGMPVERRLALVTGASAGLGREFARQLAARGIDLWLTARREGLLQSLAIELRERYGIKADVLPADLAQPGDLDRLVKAIHSTDRLQLLVNNAGFGLYGNFHELDQQAQVDMVQVHAVASIRLAHAALPGMIARKSGGLIQVASMAALISGRRSVLYSATKAFLVAFSQGLQAELKGSGVHVQALCPGFIASEFHDPHPPSGFDRQRIPRWLLLKQSDVVAQSLQAIQRGSGIVIPGFWYRLGGFFLRTALFGGLVRKFLE